MFHDFGRTMMVLGGMLFVIGALIHFGGKILPLGNLPGDFHWQSGNTSFSFPFASSIFSIQVGLRYFPSFSSVA